MDHRSGCAGSPADLAKDVDVVVDVTSRTAFHAFEERLRSLGFKEDQDEGVIGRWRHRDDDLILDAMPADAAILGFENRWQRASIPHAVECMLPSGATIRAAPPAYLLATKIDAFNDRGREDFLGSRDFGDMIALVDGREELPGEVQDTEPELRAYLASELERLSSHARFREGVSGALRADFASQGRAEVVVLPRIGQLIGELRT